MAALDKPQPIYMALSSTPWGENCAQVGTPGYKEVAKVECEAFAAQLHRHYEAAHGKPLPEGVELETTSHPHDFGTYYIVSVKFDEDNDEQAAAAYWLESDGPENWDVAALQELAQHRSGAMTGRIEEKN